MEDFKSSASAIGLSGLPIQEDEMQSLLGLKSRFDRTSGRYHFTIMKKNAYVIDFICVLIFVAIGRHTHKDGTSLGGMISTMWPFTAGLFAGWLALRLTRRSVTTKSSGLILTLSTVTLGMILRVISGQGTALAFVVVATVFLSSCLVGWRALLSLRK